MVTHDGASLGVVQLSNLGRFLSTGFLGRILEIAGVNQFLDGFGAELGQPVHQPGNAAGVRGWWT